MTDKLLRRAQPKQLSSVLISLAAMVLMLALAGAAYYFLLTPGLKLLSPGQELDLSVKLADLEAAQEYLAKLKKLEANFTKAKETAGFDKLELVLPSSLDLPSLLVQIEAIAQANRLTIESIDVTEPQEVRSAPSPTPTVTVIPQPGPGIKKVNVSVRTGVVDYPVWKNFLDSLENNLRLFDVIGYNFDPRSEQQTLNIVTYYYQN